MKIFIIIAVLIFGALARPRDLAASMPAPAQLQLTQINPLKNFELLIETGNSRTWTGYKFF